MQFTLVRDFEGIEKKGTVVIFVEKDQKAVPKEAKVLPEQMQSALLGLLDSADCKGGVGEVHALYMVDHPIKRLVVVGLGDRKQLDTNHFQKAFGTAVAWVQNKKQSNFAVLLPAWLPKKFKTQPFGVLVAKTAAVSSYHFDQYKTKEEKKLPALKEVVLCGVQAAERRALQRGIDEGSVIGRAVNHVRDLGNLPPMEMTPAYLAKEAVALAKENPKLDVKVLTPAEMKKLGMGALLGVAAGSKEPSAMIILEWKNAAKSKKPLVFVGKGVTFDSGGISIKPSSSMDEMKYDMLGGGAVLGAMRGIAELNIKNNIVGIIPAVENMPSGTAYRPGDILKTMGGKTIEVLNTDAEGRLILSDALCYAKDYEPRAVVDLATLTGACAYFMGPWHAGLFSDNNQVSREVEKAAKSSGDGVWRLPLLPEHSKLIESQMADIKNIGGRLSSAATAAAFLKEFVEYPWAHLDIAGTAWTPNMKGQPWMRAGATGFGTHLLISLAQEWID